MKVSSKNLLNIFFPVILILTIGIGIFSFNNNNTFNETTKWVKHSYKVLDKNDEIYSLAMEIESGSNSYLFTHDSNSLRSYRAATGKIIDALDSLKTFTSDNALQQMHIDSLALFINQQIQFSNVNIQLQSQKEFDKTEQSKYVEQNRFYTDRIDFLLSEIMVNETYLLRQREAANNRSIAIFHWVFYSILSCLFILLICVIGLLVTTFRRQAKEKEITEKALIHEKELNEMKSRFVSFASHEFRTPLATILSSTSLIEKYQDGKLDNMSMKHINRIKANVRSLIDLLNDFLSLGKLEEGKIDYNPVRLNVHDFSEELVSGTQELAKEGQRIVSETNGQETTLFTDERLLKNVLNNLLSNAIKYSPAGSNINYRTTYQDHEILFTIEDHGIGIPEKDQKHLFETFFRAGNATQTPGTGLGLCIVKRYLDILGGSLEFASAEGKGSTFTVHIPVKQG